MNRFIYSLFTNRWLQHSLFWLLSLFIISWYFSISNQVKVVDVIYGLFFHICLIPLVYINLRICIPRFFKQDRYVLYLLGVIMNIAIGYGLHQFTFDILIPALPLEYYMVSFTDFWIPAVIFSIYIIITSLLSLSKSWFLIEQLKSQNTQVELENLRLQINPHFLLNALNSIYGLSLKKDEKTPEAILQLSGFLKHMLYENQKFITLSDEKEHIENYVAIQKLRLSNNEQVSISIEIEDATKKIIPFVLLTFIENAFKHSDIPQNPEGFITIALKQTRDCIEFVTRNSFKLKEKTTEGIGLKNARSRLSHYYGENYRLQSNISQNCYEVSLRIDL